MGSLNWYCQEILGEMEMCGYVMICKYLHIFSESSIFEGFQEFDFEVARKSRAENELN